MCFCCFFFFSSRRRHTRYWRDWSSDVCSSDLTIRRAQIVEGDGAEPGIGNIRRDRGGAVGRTDRTGDKARLAIFGADPRRGGAGKLRALEVKLIGKTGKVVIGLRDRGRGKRVGGDDVSAGTQVIGVDMLDRLRLRQDQQIVVAPEVAMKILEW